MSESETAPKVIVILGPGRVGRSVHRQAGFREGLDSELIGRSEIAGIGSSLDGSNLLLTVPDSAISTVCDRLIGNGARPARIGHTSGATSLTALAGAAAAGIPTFSLHPLQTVPDGETALDGVPAAVTGSDQATAVWTEALAHRLGMSPFALADRHRAAYHAAASIASNFLIALEQSAVELLERSGARPGSGRELIAPLVLSTASNWAARGERALTGPIARGDRETIRAHRAAIAESAPHLGPLYEVLAERTEEVAAG